MPPPTILCHTLMHRARTQGIFTSTIWCGRRTCWRRPLPDARSEVCSGLAAEVRLLDPFQSQKVTKKHYIYYYILYIIYYIIYYIYIYIYIYIICIIYSDLKCHFRTSLLILLALVQKVKTSRKGYKMIQDDTRWYKMIQDDTRWYKMIQDDTRWYKMIQDDTRSSWKATGGSHANLPTGSGWKPFVHLFIESRPNINNCPAKFCMGFHLERVGTIFHGPMWSPSQIQGVQQLRGKDRSLQG